MTRLDEFSFLDFIKYMRGKYKPLSKSKKAGKLSRVDDDYTYDL